MLMNKIFFDLDGTLIDASERLYSLFQFLVPHSKLTKKEYWDLKRHKNSHKMILSQLFSYDENFIAQFEKKWMHLIEADEFLIKDVLYPGVREVLSALRNTYSLYVVTARQFSEKVDEELRRLGILDFFEAIFVTKQKVSKEELIRTHFYPTSNDIFVGDTGKDVQTAKACGIQSIAVAYGFMDKEVLKTYQPDLIIKNIKEIL